MRDIVSRYLSPGNVVKVGSFKDRGKAILGETALSRDLPLGAGARRRDDYGLAVRRLGASGPSFAKSGSFEH